MAAAVCVRQETPTSYTSEVRELFQTERREHACAILSGLTDRLVAGAKSPTHQRHGTASGTVLRTDRSCLVAKGRVINVQIVGGPWIATVALVRTNRPSLFQVLQMVLGGLGEFPGRDPVASSTK